MRVRWLLVFFLAAGGGLLPGSATAQTGEIAGAVTDETGAVLPGVTVTATSPAMIDVRTTVSGADGRYTLVSLAPGTYVVEFALPGFRTVRREGVQLSAGFTANIAAQMAVGGVEETVTVTGATPTVDVRNVRTQSVLDDETLNVLPNAQNVSSFSALTLGVNVSGNSGGGVDIGGTGGEMGTASVHNNRANDMKISQEGMNTNNTMGSNGGVMHFGQHYNMEGVSEVVLASNGMTADTETAGLQINYIPKDGGNTFSASGRATFTNEDFQSNNLTSELTSRGATTPGSVKQIYDYGVSLGGPVQQNRLWFFTAHRWWNSEQYSPGSFWNAKQGQKAPGGLPLYEADPKRLGYVGDPNRENSGRLTWQMAKDKLTYFGNLGEHCVCYRFTSAIRSPEAAQTTYTANNHLSQVTWTRPQSNRMLFEGGFTYLKNPFIHTPAEGVGPNDINITEQSTGFQYNSFSSGTIPYNVGDPAATDQVNARGSVAYVTGAHSLKFGGAWAHGWIENNGSNNVIPGFGPASIRVLNGVPNLITLFNHPQYSRSDFRNMGFYAQDQWTLHRVTLNLGVRADLFDGWTPQSAVPDTPYTTGFPVERIEDSPRWRDVSPRLGFAWDVRGDGRTAVKASAGRYVAAEGTGLPLSVNPANRISTSTSRVWNDLDRDFFPDGDPRNPAANGELGASLNAAFGRPVFTTFFDDAIMSGNRPHTWQMSAGIERELMDNTRVSVTYFRTSHFNQRVTDNESLTAADFTPYCVTVPSHAGLPGGGGNQLCGFANITPAGQARSPRNVVKLDTAFGDQTEVFDGVDTMVTARFDSGALLQGGVSVGRTVNDSCFVVDSPEALYQCRNVSPWWDGGGQIKLSGAYPLPWGVSLSAVFQNIQGREIRALTTFLNAQVAPSLGRNLSACPAATGTCNATVTIDVFPERNSAFEGRISQLDFRVLKDFTGRFGRVRATLDLYNAFNASPVLGRSQTFGTTGTAWGRVTSFMSGRLIKLGVQYSWN
ncbi:MAG: TonB-dependent receptor [Acidimicrobiia bacterium]|nr:TonB-dependent receptor [Acidimicrobiia bacterium]